MPNNIYLLLTPSYGSMGDQAIAYAEERYLHRQYPNDQLIVLNEDDTLLHIDDIARYSSCYDVFYLQGGGNLGSLYPKIESDRELVIRKLHNKKIIIFPQSIYYKKCTDIAIAQSVYSQSNITLYAREIYSYHIMKEFFPLANVVLKPDIVYSLYDRFCSLPYDRKKILISLRNDKESILQSHRNLIIESLKNKYPYSECISMYSEQTVTHEDREKYVINSIQQFGNAAAVVTDRLHGCIFSAITKTPCVFLPNAYHKNIGNYQWLQSLNYIKMLHPFTIDELLSELSDLLSLNETKKSNLMLKEW